MNTTPLSHLTDEELSAHISNKENPTDEEIEAMLRLDRLLDVKHDFECEFDLLITRSKELKPATQATVATRRKQTEMFNGLNAGR